MMSLSGATPTASLLRQRWSSELFSHRATAFVLAMGSLHRVNRCSAKLLWALHLQMMCTGFDLYEDDAIVAELVLFDVSGQGRDMARLKTCR